MKQLLLSAAALVAASAAALPCAAAVEIAQPWSRPAVAGSTAVGYLTLVNRGKAPDAVVAVESPLARKVEVHRSSMSAGVMSMQRVEQVAVPAGGSVTFAPGGNHLMFLGLAKTLRAGDSLPAVLRFASGARVKTVFQVGAGAAPPKEHAHH
jgi:copper(I)-binding protein